MFNDRFVRQLCEEISSEQDPQRVNELMSLLQAVIKEDSEEIRVRMAFLTKKYADVISESKAAD